MPGHELGNSASDGGMPHPGRAYGRMLTAQHDRTMGEETASISLSPVESIGIFVVASLVDHEVDDYPVIERGRE